jgi:hypothetical protein
MSSPDSNQPSQLGNNTVITVGTGKRPTWFRLARWGVILATIWYLGAYVAGNWVKLVTYQWRISFYSLMLSIPFLLFSFALLPLATKQALLACGHSITLRQAVWLYFLPQPAKYLLGGALLIPGRLMLYQMLRIPLTSGGVSLVVESGAMTLAALLTGLLGQHLSVLIDASHQSYLWIGFVLPITAGVRVGLGGRLQTVRNWFRITRPRTLMKGFVRAFCMYLGFWSVVGVGFTLMTQAFTDVYPELCPKLIGALALSWAAGMLSFVAPAGLGARESAMVFLLTQIWPAPLPIVVALGARLWWTLGDAMGVASAIALSGFRPGWRISAQDDTTTTEQEVS